MPRWGSLVLLVAMAGCQSAPSSAWRSVRSGAEAEALAGRNAAPLLELRCGGIVRDSKALARIEEAGADLLTVAPAVGPCQYAVLATENVNAYSLPGGLVYLTRGLFKRIQDDRELIAAVIAHEVAHVVRKDSLKPAAVSPGEALDREVAADLAAARRMAAAGFSPQAVLRLLEVTSDVQPPGWGEVRARRLRLALRETQDGPALLASR